MPQDFEQEVAARMAAEAEAAEAARRANMPQMRAPTWREQISDMGQSVYETVADQPLARILDAIGASDFGGTAKSFTDPEAGVKRGEMLGPPGNIGQVLKGIKANLGPPHSFDDAVKGIDPLTDAPAPPAKPKAQASDVTRQRAADASRKERAVDLQARLAEHVPEGGLGLQHSLDYIGEGRYALKPETMERLRILYDAALKSPNKANWDAVTDTVLQAFGGDKQAAHRWARVWGAMSPNTDVVRNTQEAVSMQKHLLDSGGRLPSVEEVRTWENPYKITMAGSKVPNVHLAMKDQPLSTPKVENMAELMVGRRGIPLDVHAIWGLGAEHTKLDQELVALRQFIYEHEGKGALSPNAKGQREIYDRYANALSDALEQIAPGSGNNGFATFWEGVRQAKGLKWQGAPNDILQYKGLDKMGAMLDPNLLAKALQQKGWAVPGIYAVLAALREVRGGQNGAQGAAPEDEDRPQ